MNKKLSLIILFLLFISLISVLLAFMAFSKGGNNKDVGQLKTGYEQLSKQVNELKVTTEELGTKLNNNNDPLPTTPVTQPTKPVAPPTPATPVTTTTQTKTVAGNSVNMRSGATTNAKVVRQLPRNEKVTPTGLTASSGGYQWTQVKDSKGNLGWVVSNYIK